MAVPVGISVDDFLRNEEKNLLALSTEIGCANIPFLNNARIEDLKDYTLVRFRGMVQELMDSIVYMQKCAVVKDGKVSVKNCKYRDKLSLKANETIDEKNEQNLWAYRQSLFVVTVPALNYWVLDAEQEIFTRNMTSSSRPFNKELQRLVHRVKAWNFGPGKQSKEQLEKEQANPSIRSCIIHMYDSRKFEKMPLNTVIEVIGFLSRNPEIEEENPEWVLIEKLEHRARNPSASKVPRIHAVKTKIFSHTNVLVPQTKIREKINFDEKLCEELYDLLHSTFSQCLFGDTIAARYLMAHMISSVRHRLFSQPSEPYGSFSMNLCNIPPKVNSKFPRMLNEIIEMLLPASHFLELTVHNFNTLPLQPRKDESEKFVSGMFQLAHHTHLVLDETTFQPDQLSEKGYKAVSALQILIKQQKLACDFTHYTILEDTDVPVLVLSTYKSFLPSECYMPLKADPEKIDSMEEEFELAKSRLEPKIELLRKYLTLLTIVEYRVLLQDTDTLISKHFVSPKDNEDNAVNDTHSEKIFARLLAVYHGKSDVSDNFVEIAKLMEKERLERLESVREPMKPFPLGKKPRKRQSVPTPPPQSFPFE